MELLNNTEIEELKRRETEMIKYNENLRNEEIKAVEE